MKRYHVWCSGGGSGFSRNTPLGDRDTLEEAKALGESHANGEAYGWHPTSDRSWSLAVIGRPIEIYIYDRQEGNGS